MGILRLRIGSRLFILTGAICLGWGLLQNAWAVSSIQHIGYQMDSARVRIILDLDTLPDYTAYKTDPQHLVIELNETFQISPVWNFKVGSLVEEVRLARKDNKTLGLVVDLQAEAHFKVFSQPAQGNSPSQIIIDILPAIINEPPPSTDANKGLSDPPKNVGAQFIAPTIGPDKSSPYNSFQPGSNTTSAGNTDRSVKLVVIDAGHGGTDPGAIGPDGVKEKDVTLAIARRLSLALKSNPRLDVRLTRNGDYFVPLWDRVEITRDCRADLFISIHANANVNPDYQGASVFYLSETASDEVARRLAEKENAADLLGGTPAISDQSSKALFINLNQTSSYRESLLLGQKVIQSYRQIKEVAMHPQLRSAPFAVLKSLSVPSILLETAFISNSQEEGYLASDSFQEKIAQALAQAVHDYFFDLPPDKTHQVKSGETLWRISQQYGLAPNQLRQWNNLTEQDPIYSGQKLKLAVQ